MQHLRIAKKKKQLLLEEILSNPVQIPTLINEKTPLYEKCFAHCMLKVRID